MAPAPARLPADPALTTALRRYATLELAWTTFQKDPSDLTPEQAQQLAQLVERRLTQEELVLDSTEAASCAPDDGMISATLAELRQRYASAEAHEEALFAQGMSLADLRLVVGWNLHVERTLELVGQQAPPPAQEFLRERYDAEPGKFLRPERRTASHLLIVLTGDAPPSAHSEAEALLQDLRVQLTRGDGSWAHLVARHSECPSALSEGRLGTFPRGQLYPELDAALFAMEPGELSAPLRSEAGWHLLRCDNIEPAATVPFEEARASLERFWWERLRRQYQKEWLRALRSRPTGTPTCTPIAGGAQAT